MATEAHVRALFSHRTGECQQILRLAEALERSGARLEVVRPAWTSPASLLGLLRRPTLLGLEADTRTALTAGAPDLVISAGLRNEPPVRWLRRHRNTATVMLGRTWAGADAFDLTVTTPQYRLPPHARVLENPGTQHRLTPEGLARARDAGAGRFGDLPTPRLGVLVGGDSGPYRFGPRAADHLLERALALAGDGSILVTTSSRTPCAAADRIEAGLGPRDRMFRFQPDADTTNPYPEILAWADALLVTGDSIAMVSEAVATGKPVRILDPEGGSIRDRSLRSEAYRALMALGPLRLSRDLYRVHAGLVASGLAAWDDVPLPPPQAVDRRLPEDYMAATVERVEALLRKR
ncbi:MAG: ELM1/GtrOC1 family putative glycosyltransferase [Gammaproteobacteria bacterium]|nr:ELM1/GtrOC1 family putative glycosyltransferase [Gammaproteobacteria bacterium]